MSMSPPENLQATQNETQELQQKLLASVTTLQKEITALKADDDHRSYPQKRPRNGDGENSNCREDASRDGDSNGNCDSDLDPSEDEIDL